MATVASLLKNSYKAQGVIGARNNSAVQIAGASARSNLFKGMVTSPLHSAASDVMKLGGFGQTVRASQIDLFKGMVTSPLHSALSDVMKLGETLHSVVQELEDQIGDFGIPISAYWEDGAGSNLTPEQKRRLFVTVAYVIAFVVALEPTLRMLFEYPQATGMFLATTGYNCRSVGQLGQQVANFLFSTFIYSEE